MAINTKGGAQAAGRDVSSEIAFLARALKAPTLGDAVTGWPNGLAPSRGRTRSSWPLACSGKYGLESHTVVKVGSRRPGSRPANRWKTSTTTMPAVSNATASRTWQAWTSSPAKRTSCSWDRPEPGKPTWPQASRSEPAKQGTGSCSPQLRNGSGAWPKPTTPGGCNKN